VKFGAMIIHVTRDPAKAFLLADEFLLLDTGRVLQTGLIEDVFPRPANEAVARLLGAANSKYWTVSGRCLTRVG
jgi:iron(III) transport system ATP-binding protein